jgi:hypothetical protein
LSDSNFSIIKAKDILKEVPLNWFAGSSLYNHPVFLSTIAPGKCFYARIADPKGLVAFFPFAGQNLYFKWRVFQVGFCQKYDPFCQEGQPNAHHWECWFRFLAQKTLNPKWPVGFLPSYPIDNSLSAQPKNNQYFQLGGNIESVISHWKQNRKQALNKSKALNTRQVSHSDFFELLLQIVNSPGQIWKPVKKEISILNSLSKSDDFSKSIYRFVVFDDQEPLSAVLVLKWADRLYYLFSISSRTGFKKEALTRIFYEMISVFLSQDLVFDFEGSSIPGVRDFFSSLGGVSETYHVISIKS